MSDLEAAISRCFTEPLQKPRLDTGEASFLEYLSALDRVVFEYPQVLRFEKQAQSSSTVIPASPAGGSISTWSLSAPTTPRRRGSAGSRRTWPRRPARSGRPGRTSGPLPHRARRWGDAWFVVEVGE